MGKLAKKLEKERINNYLLFSHRAYNGCGYHSSFDSCYFSIKPFTYENLKNDEDMAFSGIETDNIIKKMMKS